MVAARPKIWAESFSRLVCLWAVFLGDHKKKRSIHDCSSVKSSSLIYTGSCYRNTRYDCFNPRSAPIEQTATMPPTRSYYSQDSFSNFSKHKTPAPSHGLKSGPFYIDGWARFGSGVTVELPLRLSIEHEARLTAKIITEVAVSMSFRIGALYRDGLLPLATLIQMMQLYTLMHRYADDIYPARGLDNEYCVLKFDHGPVMVHALREVHLLLSNLIFEQYSGDDLEKLLELVDKLEALANVIMRQEDAASVVPDIAANERFLRNGEVYDALTLLMQGASGNQMKPVLTERPTPRTTRMPGGRFAHAPHPPNKLGNDRGAPTRNPRPSITASSKQRIQSPAWGWQASTTTPSKRQTKPRYSQYPDHPQHKTSHSGVPTPTKANTVGSKRDGEGIGSPLDGPSRNISEQKLNRGKAAGKLPKFEMFHGSDSDEQPSARHRRQHAGGRDLPYAVTPEEDEVTSRRMKQLKQGMSSLEARMRALLSIHSGAISASHAREVQCRAHEEQPTTPSAAPTLEKAIAARNEVLTPATTTISQSIGTELEHDRKANDDEEGREPRWWTVVI